MKTPAGNFTITIDGPAGCGKSTTARRLAEALGFELLDTGAMYRAAAVIAMQQGIDPADGPEIALAVEQADLHFDWSTHPPRLLASAPREQDLTDLLRTEEISRAASHVAGCPEVRAVLVGQQRRIRDAHPRLVSEGRDQGSVVFPEALVKFFLDATPEARARRRAGDLKARGISSDLIQLAADIRARDWADRSRKVGPLIIPDNAVIIDTTSLTEDEVVRLLHQNALAALDQSSADRSDVSL